jgi:hypothetical protein
MPKDPPGWFASGLSGAPRITQGGKPPQGVAAINPVMHQEASDEGVHLVLRERRQETIKRGMRSLPPLHFRFPIRRDESSHVAAMFMSMVFPRGSGTGLPSSDIRWRAGGSLRLFSSGAPSARNTPAGWLVPAAPGKSLARAAGPGVLSTNQRGPRRGSPRPRPQASTRVGQLRQLSTILKLVRLDTTSPGQSRGRAGASLLTAVRLSQRVDLLTRLIYVPLGDRRRVHGPRIGAVQYCSLPSLIHTGLVGAGRPRGGRPHGTNGAPSSCSQALP